MDMHRSKTSNIYKERKEEDVNMSMDMNMNMELPGFRFHPTDDELVSFYLRKRVFAGSNVFHKLICDLDIYKSDPWELPKMARLCEGQTEWYFFCPRDKKYKNSDRPNRVTKSGFWKATGTDKQIHSSTQLTGLKKSLVFYVGRASKGTKTDWMMHEFRLSGHIDGSNEGKCWAICKIYKRKGNALTHCRLPYAEKSAFEGKPLRASNSNLHNNPIETMHTNADNYSFHSDDDLKSQDSSLTLSTNYEAQSDATTDAIHDESLNAVVVNCLEFVDNPKPAFKEKKPVGLELDRSHSMNWHSEFLSPLFSPVLNASILNYDQTNAEDGLFVDHQSQDVSSLSITRSSVHLVWSPQSSTVFHLWDQPSLFQA